MALVLAGCKPLHLAPPQGKAAAEVLTGLQSMTHASAPHFQVQQRAAAETPASQDRATGAPHESWRLFCNVL